MATVVAIFFGLHANPTRDADEIMTYLVCAEQGKASTFSSQARSVPGGVGWAGRAARSTDATSWSWSRHLAMHHLTEEVEQNHQTSFALCPVKNKADRHHRAHRKTLFSRVRGRPAPFLGPTARAANHSAPGPVPQRGIEIFVHAVWARYSTLPAVNSKASGYPTYSHSPRSSLSTLTWFTDW